MDPLHFCISILPVSIYMLLIGSINLSRRSLVTTGARDLAALAIAVSGFMIAGPLELFLPEAVAAVLGAWVWVPLIMLYALVTTLVLLLMRPRLVIYNISASQLRVLLERVLRELDPQTSWAGNAASAPNLGVQLAVESYPGIRNVSLSSVGPEQSQDGWHHLRVHLAAELAQHTQPRNAQGASYVMLSLVLAGTVLYSVVMGQQEIAQAFVEMLRIEGNGP